MTDSTRQKTSAATVESRALVFAIAGFVIGGLIGLLVLGGDDVPIAGKGSLGEAAAIVASIVALLAFVAGYVQSFDEPGRRWLKRVGLGRQILDIAGLAFTHAAICLLLWAVTSWVMQKAFIDAVLFPTWAAMILGGIAAVSAYFVYLSAAHMTTSHVAVAMVIFLVLGILTSMLTAADPHWWMENISALGMNDDRSSAAFNLTLVIAGAVLTTLANYMTSELETGPLVRDGAPDELVAARRIRYVKYSIALIGIFLAAVGVFHVDDHFWIHTASASGMAVVYGVLVFRLPRIAPDLPRAFFIVGYLFIAIIVVTGVMFGVGLWDLTAVEILAFALIFTWLVVLIRMISAASIDAADAAVGSVDADRQQRSPLGETPVA